jgi:hypothetical protein
MKRAAFRRIARALAPVAILSALWAAAGAPIYMGG